MPLFPLEEFNTHIVSSDPTLTTDTSLEEHKLESFEQGYKAGWDDAVTAQADEQARISADFASNLQDLSFTYHQAQAQVLKSLEPLLKDMVTKVLPRLAGENLAQTILDEVRNLAKGQSEPAVEIVISPASRASMERLLEAETKLAVNLIDEPSMAKGLAYIRFNDIEKQIDLESMISSFSQAVDGFFEQQEKVAAHG